MILAPSITVQIGGLPPVICKIVDRAVGQVARFVIPGEDISGVTKPMLREWFESHGQGGIAGVQASELCANAAEQLVERDPI